jgi:hypothetical protein
VKTRTFAGILVLTLPSALWMQGCSGLPTLSSLTAFGRKQESGVDHVDQLLTRVEGVQIEAAVSKERAHDALATLLQLVARDFSGDPAAAHQQLAAQVAQSSEQARKFAASVAPMKELGARVFDAWTADLEQFGGAALRRQSQARLEETRARHGAIVASAVAVQLAYDSFNRALNDHVLYLEHDFNAAAVAALASEIDALGAQAFELERRCSACMAAADMYVQAAALRGQAEVAAVEARPKASSAEPLEPEPAAPAAQPLAVASERPLVVPRKRAITTKPPNLSQGAPALAEGGKP